MARMLHRPTVSAVGQKVFIATPTYQSLSAGYSYALFHTAKSLARAGIQSELAIYAGDCHVDDARNRLVRDFLETDCTDLLFIDADLRWDEANVVKILSYDRDVVAATYPLKQDEEKYPVRFIPGEIWSDKDGLIEVESVPTGFLRIKRHVLELLADKADKFPPKSDNRSHIPLIFERQLHDGMRWGGDYTFCRKWREHGSIYLDPNMFFDHHGDQIHTGRCANWLLRNSGVELPGLRDVQSGTASEDVFSELYKDFDNPFAATPDLLCALSELVQDKTVVLESGCGLSTLVMAAANPDCVIHALEHDRATAIRIHSLSEKHGLSNIHIHCSPLVDGWYQHCPDIQPDMVVCDGPPRDLGDRSRVYEYAHDCLLVVDDAETEWESVTKWAAGRDVMPVGKAKNFLVVR